MGRATAVGLVGVCLMLFAGGSATTSASTMAPAEMSWRGTAAVLPANAASDESQFVYLNSVSCASAGNCSAVGTYIDSSGAEEGLLLTRKAGKWQTGVEAVLPSNVHVPPGAYLTSVSCTSPGNCTAVGTYDDSSGAVEGLLLTETAGQWATGVESPLPANTRSRPYVQLQSVSCSSPGNCSAVGSYTDNSDVLQGLQLTETAGQWATAVETTLPSNADVAFGASLTSVSCSSTGNCSAVGTYAASSNGEQGLLATQTAGTWGDGVEAVLPSNAVAGKPVDLKSVSCASGGNCSAVGTYDNPSSPQDTTINDGVLLTEKAGRWQTGVKAALPAHPVSPDQVDLDSVSCAAAGACVAVGNYAGGTGEEGLLLTEKGGKWRTGVKAALPAETGATTIVYLSSVSCPSPGNCTAAGGYQDNSGDERGLLVTETAGGWAAGVEAVLPAAVDDPGSLTTVSCSSALSCSAVGSNDLGIGEGFLLDSSAKPCVVPKLQGRALPAAKRSIKSHDCSVGKVGHALSPRVKRGHVISQKPSPGRRLKHGAKVSLVVSNGR